jgi:hypothetical protein
LNFICVVDVSIGWRCGLQVLFKVPFTPGCLDWQILCQVQETQSGGVMPFKYWLSEAVGDRLMRAVWGITPNHG